MLDESAPKISLQEIFKSHCEKSLLPPSQRRGFSGLLRRPLIILHHFIIKYRLHISLSILYSMSDFSLSLVQLTDIRLKYQWHRIHKKWYIKYCIHHSDHLPFPTLWCQISKSYRRCRDHIKIKSIKIWPWLCSLKMMYQKSSEYPTYQKNKSNNYEFLAWMKIFKRHIIQR